ncbi:MAG TPA: hypothetical protein VJW94_08715 [Candidatus Acidoferrum sp.]|nr:hypothetical protein [Candidatus Acidoferrum sp.]
MPHEFRQWEEELEPQPSAVRLGGPPRKSTGIGVLDPPGPPAGPRSALPASFLLRLLGGLILAGLALFLLFQLFAR